MRASLLILLVPLLAIACSRVSLPTGYPAGPLLAGPAHPAILAPPGH